MFFDMAGEPNTNFTKGIKDEHCVLWGNTVDFTTTNYGVKTNPLKEYEISTGKRGCPENELKDRKGRKVRIIKRIEELKTLEMCQKAGLTEDEILAVVRALPTPPADS